MSRDPADLLKEALELPSEQRSELARALIDSLEADEQPEGPASDVESAWRLEVERREQQIESDPTLLIPAEKVFAEAERRLSDIRAARESRRRSG